MNKKTLKTVLQNSLNFLFSLITLIWMIIVVILVQSGQTISSINWVAKYFMFTGFAITIFFEMIANYFHYISKIKIRFKLEILFRILVIIIFIAFIIGAIMYTNGDGSIRSIF